MSIGSAVQDRTARWCDELDGYGYALEAPGRRAAALGQVTLRAARPRTYGGPGVVVDVGETWALGSDPDGLGLELHGCFLLVSGWHVQIAPGDAGAQRLDVDRRKPGGLAIHLHPYGRPNSVRVPAAPLGSPESWLEDVENLIFDLTT